MEPLLPWVPHKQVRNLDNFHLPNLKRSIFSQPVLNFQANAGPSHSKQASQAFPICFFLLLYTLPYKTFLSLPHFAVLQKETIHFMKC